MKNNKTLLVNNTEFDIVQVFCFFDDLCNKLGFMKKNPEGGRPPCLSLSEVMTVILIQKELCIENKKALWKYLKLHHQNDFPNLGEYTSFCLTLNRLAPQILEIVVILCTINRMQSGMLKFVDSTKLEVCKIWRAGEHKTMEKLASKSKSTTGWFYGLKLHIMCDEQGNLLAISFTSGNVDDRTVLANFLQKIKDSVVGADAGYCGKPAQEEAKKNNNVVLAAVRKNMKTIGTMFDQQVLNLRSVVERCFSVMKTRMRLVSTLARSEGGYLAHYIRVLFMYIFKRPVA
jgi:transposase